VKKIKHFTVIGGGLSGSEAAWQIAKAGFLVDLYEMRPLSLTGVHQTDQLAELVCSNSLGSNQRNRPSGLLKEELILLKSLLIECAQETSLPAGSALAVDRLAFSTKVTSLLQSNPNIRVIREEVKEIPDSPVIIATGPLTSTAMSTAISNITGVENLYFFDAISPSIEAQSIDMNLAFRASRYKFETEAGDYINCPLNKQEYELFIDQLVSAETVVLRSFEDSISTGIEINNATYFEACLPIEVLAKRDRSALTFGPMRPVGLRNTHNLEKPYSVVQLRQEDLADSIYNLVGFQTNLTYPEQKRIFTMIPGLGNANFVRYGQMHRNTYINSPSLLKDSLQYRFREDLFFAGQIAGIEGYVGNIASGLIAGINAVRYLNHQPLLSFPIDTMIGAMHNYIANASPDNFQPMKANFGLLPPLEVIPENKQERGYCQAKRSLRSMQNFIGQNHF
jgi:methylenetetrahydrofolate--tRNA-(uracil-5-)-methyltransferase